jgi:hypothetical protein
MRTSRTVYHRDGTKTHLVDGVAVSEAEQDRAFPVQEFKGTARSKPKWPRPSFALGGMPKDRDKLSDLLRSKGVPTYVDRDGNPVPTSNKHQRKIAKALGFANMDDNA